MLTQLIPVLICVIALAISHSLPDIVGTPGIHGLPRLGPDIQSGSPPLVAPGISSISFTSATTGCAAGTSYIICTHDGGHIWRRRYAGPAQIVGLDFVDEATGWAVGTRTLLGTRDGGMTWRPLGEPAHPLRTIFFVDAMHGWGMAGGTDAIGGLDTEAPWSFALGKLVRTADGGRTWTIAATPEPVDSVCFASASDGWIARGSRVYRTRDGGRHWAVSLHARIYDDGAGWHATIHCTRSGAAWVRIAGSSGASSQLPYIVYRTLDGGRHWRAVAEEGYFFDSYPTPYQVPEATGTGAYPGPFTLIGDRSAYFVGVNFGLNTISLAATNDGGHTWRSATIPRLSWHIPCAISFVSPTSGWITGRIGRHDVILHTPDGGRTWEEQFEMPAPTPGTHA